MDKDNDKELNSQKETTVIEKQTEKPLTKQEEFSVLEKIADETRDEITTEYNKDENIVKGLAAKIGGQNIPANLDTLELKAEEIKNESLDSVNKEKKTAALETKFDHLPNYDFDSPESKLITLRGSDSTVQARFNEKINPQMRAAIALIGDKVFNKTKLPYALIGSNCYIPHTEFSAKIPDDLDVIFGIKDLGLKPADIEETGKDKDGHPLTRINIKDEDLQPGVYKDLVELQKQGLVQNLHVEELEKFGGDKNGCVKVKCQIKSGDGWVEMEAFAQHMISEINAGEDFNGIINLGAEEQTVEVVDCDGVKINIGSEKTAEELYLKNIVNEFALYDLNGWENRSYLSAKALQRIFNVTNLDSERGDKVIDRIIEKVGNVKPPTELAKTAQTVLINLWETFKASGDINGPGLVEHLMETKGVKIPETGNEEEMQILKTEQAVDIMTGETQVDMKSISQIYLDMEKEAQKLLDNPEKNPAEVAAMQDRIVKQKNDFIEIGHKYKRYARQADNKNPRDFCVYAAIPRLRNYFIKPTVTKLQDLWNLLNEKKD